MGHFLVFSILLLPFTAGLDSETNDPVYKFAIVDGEPIVLNASSIIQVTSFDECTDKCLEEFDCVVAYQSNASDPCYLFQYDSIQEIKSNASGGEGQVAFKVYTDQPSCSLNAQLLLNGKRYPLYPNDTLDYLWKIDTSEDGWKVTYLRKELNDTIVCGNFLHNRPYPDSCETECMDTMVQVNAKPGPLMGSRNIKDNLTSSDECVKYCWKDLNCFVNYYDKDSKECWWWSIDNVHFLEKVHPSENKVMAIKIITSNSTCGLTTDELINGKHYYLPYHRLKQAWNANFYNVKTTDKYYVVNTYVNEEATLVRSIPGCQMPFVGTVAGKNLSDVNCYNVINSSAITQELAKTICGMWGGALVTDRFEGYMQRCSTGDGWLAGMMFNWPMPYDKPIWGFPAWMKQPLKIWVGLEKNLVTGVWAWARPDWGYQNSYTFDTCDPDTGKRPITTTPGAPMTWAPGEPKSQAGYNCAYLEYKYNSPWPGYAMVAAPCNESLPDINGFMCGVDPEGKQGIPPMKSIADLYGVPMDSLRGYFDTNW
ncbi:PAN-3 domain-containing protein [Caenorhabditis elegans]|uniref:PAN-3 domain-containing protein n=1 Tax=Caenorhabditis elegans TaxID=6239 RepID=Q9U2Q4_CAEEL|nr:PAN-3 domain-containing protein [Caenorhabditis elegans]CAB54340.2 PAN-3 domain-containing protein [Caenorhabditis elegans]|eukprot:NP_493285.2 Uncharacterized protein CELE_Y26D4A.2 [Caenorhabditis elegans]